MHTPPPPPSAVAQDRAIAAIKAGHIINIPTRSDEAVKDSVAKQSENELVGLFANIPALDLVRLVIVEILKRGINAGDMWNNLTNILWCRQQLGLRNALLRELKIWETASEYAQTYSLLDNLFYDKLLILRDSTGLKVPAFIKWAEGIGLKLEEICKLFDIELPFENKQDPVIIKTIEECVSKANNGPDEGDKTVRDYIEKHSGCEKQFAIDELSKMGISKVQERLEKHLEVLEITQHLYVRNYIERLDETTTILQDALAALFNKNGGYTSAHELFQTVQVKLDDFFFENGAFESEGAVYDIAAYLFNKVRHKGSHYIFRGGIHIWREKPNYPMTDTGLLIHWARLNGGILTRQLAYDNFERRGASETGRISAFTTGMSRVGDKFWVLGNDEFLLKEGINLSSEFIADVKRCIDELLLIEEQENGLPFIPMGVVGDDFFDRLPLLPDNRSWSILLLQSIICDYSKELHYQTIVRSSYLTQLHAAIVPENCEYLDFSDLVYVAVKIKNDKPSVLFDRVQFVEFLKSEGLYPEDMAGRWVENALSKNIHFKWLDKNNLVVS